MVTYGRDNLRIAFCHHYSMSFWSGGEKQIAYLAQRLSSDGFNVEIHSLPVRKKNNIPNLGNVKYSEKWFHEIDADIAYFLYSPYIENFFRCKNGTVKIAAIRGFPLVPEIQHKSIINISPYRRIKEIGLMRSLVWWHSRYMRDLRSFDALHIISPAMVQLFPSFEGKIYDISNWIDTDLYNPNGEKREEFTVLFASRNEWVKGIDIYNEIAKISKENNLGIKFLATGKKGDHDSNYENVGFLDDNSLTKLYSSIHATIVPTRIDTFGNTIPESLACGTPVITTKIPAHEKMQLPLLYADIVKEYIEKIIEIKNMWEFDKDSYYELCSKCRDSVIKYNFKDTYPKFINMFREVVEDI